MVLDRTVDVNITLRTLQEELAVTEAHIHNQKENLALLQVNENAGLLFFQNVILPFRDEFPKDTELYRLLTTKPSEVVKEKRIEKE